MSELLDNQIDTQICESRGCDENKEINKEKTTVVQKTFSKRKDFTDKGV